MHILINISSCGTLIGQAWTKTAFGVTLLRMSNRWQSWILWFCIFTMNLYMLLKVIFQWAKVCGKDSYQNWYRLDFCIGWEFRDDFKEGGNGELNHPPRACPSHADTYPSVQHHHGLRVCHVSLAHHPVLGDEKGGEGWPLCNDEPRHDVSNM